MNEKELFERGIAEFNNGQFFECHDTLEELWFDLRGESKLFVQGLIQSAVGVFHAMRGNFSGADSQLTKALTKLEKYPEHFLGIEVFTLRAELELLREALRERVASGEEQFDPMLIPSIIYMPGSSTLANL